MKEAPLETLLDVLIDHRGKTPKKLGGDFTDSGVRVVSAIHIKQGRVNWEERSRFVSEEMYERWMSEKVRRGDVLLTSEAPLGEVAQIPDDEPLVLSQRLFALRGKAGLLDSAYLRYFLESPLGQRRLRNNESGSTVSGIQQALLRKILIPLHDYVEQRRIAGVLGAFDDLIETNQRLIEGLEALIRTLFAGEGFDRLPSDEDASIEVGTLVDINPKAAKPKGEAPYIDMAALPTRGALIGKPDSRFAQGGAKFENGDTLLARITPCLENGKTGFVTNLRPGQVGVGSTEFIVLRGRGDTPAIWCYCLARSPRFRSFAVQQLSHGTSGRQRLSPTAVAEYSIALPSEESLARFRRQTEPLVGTMVELHEETLQLIRQRDELLPLLMSGKVVVRSAEEDAVVAADNSDGVGPVGGSPRHGYR